jgi:hypothetical protein
MCLDAFINREKIKYPKDEQEIGILIFETRILGFEC